MGKMNIPTSRIKFGLGVWQPGSLNPLEHLCSWTEMGKKLLKSSFSTSKDRITFTFQK